MDVESIETTQLMAVDGTNEGITCKAEIKHVVRIVKLLGGKRSI
jgi:hypothetical protein